MKNFILAVTLMLVSATLWAAGPSQQWKLDVTGSEEGVLEIAEIELHSTAGGDSVIDLFRNFTFEESSPIGATTWSISHNLGVRISTVDTTVIAYAVDVVAPGDWFYDTNTLELHQRTNLDYVLVEYTSGSTGGEPASPEVDDVYHDTDLNTWEQWSGAVWAPITVTETTVALPVPDSVDPTTTTLVPGTGSAASGGPARNDTVELVFPQAVVGAATIRGASFDTPSSNRPGDAIPVIEHFENRPASAVFDGNAGSWFKSKRAPSDRSPLTLEYTYWVGDPTRYPSVLEYSITAKNKSNAPKSWKLLMYSDGQWVTVDQRAAVRFEDGETRVFTIE